jgi:ubiquinone/menaquinone biosynthesis C-methylase UbiE
MKDAKYIPALGYDFLTPFYDTVVRLTTRETTFKNEMVKQLEISPNQTVLDLACGTGTLAILIKETYPQAQVFGIDGDARVLQIAESKAHRQNADINFEQGFSFELPYADETFARVTSSLFFHHLTRENKLKTLLEVKRILQADGEFYLADWGLPSNFLMKTVSRGIEWLDGKETTADNFRGNLPSLIEEAGFGQIEETASFDTLFGTIRLLKIKK